MPQPLQQSSLSWLTWQTLISGYSAHSPTNIYIPSLLAWWWYLSSPVKSCSLVTNIYFIFCCPHSSICILATVGPNMSVSNAHLMLSKPTTGLASWLQMLHARLLLLLLAYLLSVHLNWGELFSISGIGVEGRLLHDGDLQLCWTKAELCCIVFDTVMKQF